MWESMRFSQVAHCMTSFSFRLPLCEFLDPLKHNRINLVISQVIT